MSNELDISVEHAPDLSSAVGESDVCVTCTPSRSQFLERDFVRPGTFVAAVGADSPGKQELDPRLLGENVVVVDLLEQCVSVGALQHAIRHGLMTAESVRGELGDIVAGNVVGRSTDGEIIVFDSTGTALQDTAAAVLVYQRALSAGKGRGLDFTAT
jgi:ornithine cyclodeaminase/alanine dehydrogenase